MKLRKLPVSGDWVEISKITKVEAFEDYVMNYYGHKTEVEYPSLVKVNTGETSLTIECESFEQAQSIRDEIAEWTNEEIEAP